MCSKLESDSASIQLFKLNPARPPLGASDLRKITLPFWVDDSKMRGRRWVLSPNQVECKIFALYLSLSLKRLFSKSQIPFSS